MGYPMTWRRILNRNRLLDGDYESPPESLRSHVNFNPEWPEEVRTAILPHYVHRVDAYEKWGALLAGDIRRLERDVVDEGEICRVISHRTGIESDTVAAVLKEFMDL